MFSLLRTSHKWAAVLRWRTSEITSTVVGGQSDFRDIECQEGICVLIDVRFLQDSTLDMLNLMRLIRIRSETLENPNLIGKQQITDCYATSNWNWTIDTFERAVICRINLAIDRRWATHAFKLQAFYFRDDALLCVVQFVTHRRRFISFREWFSEF